MTTAVIGNCGVGFAPCRASDRDRLVDLMQGVEDIPGTALSEGITWDWESFPQFLDAIDSRPHTIDYGAHIPHDALRVYVMGDRAAAEEPASDDDIATMKRHVRFGARGRRRRLRDRALGQPPRRGWLLHPRLGGERARRAHLVADLPAGGKRLLQDAEGYRATLVSGAVITADGQLTDERPGRLVRVGRV